MNRGAAPRLAASRLDALAFAAACVVAIAGVGAGTGCAGRLPVTKIVGGRQIATRSISDAAYEHVSRALLFEEDEQWDQAAAELQRALAHDSDAPELHAHLADVFLRLDRRQDAAAAIKASLQIEVTVDGLVAQAHLDELDGKPAAAVAALDRATRLASFADDPVTAENAYLELGDAALMALDAARARRAFADLCAALPSSLAGRLRLGALHWALGDAGEAERQLKAALDEEPNQIEARLSLSWLAWATGRSADARASFREALDRSEGAYEVAAAFARFLVAAGEPKEAAALLEDLPAPDGKDADAAAHWIEFARAAKRFDEALAFARGLADGDAPDQVKQRVPLLVAGILYDRGQRALAAATLLAVAKEAPVYREARLMAADVLRQDGKPAEAARALDGLAGAGAANAAEVARAPDDRAAIDLGIARALVDERAGDPARALRRIQDLLTTRPGHVRLVLVEAAIEERRGQWRRALELTEGLLVKNPGSVEALNFWGFVAADRGHEIERARGRLVTALTLEPASGPIIDSLGWAYFRAGDLGHAAAFLEQARRLEPDDPEILAHVGELHARRAEAEAAVVAFRKALTLRPDEGLRRRLEEQLARLEAQKKAARP